MPAPRCRWVGAPLALVAGLGCGDERLDALPRAAAEGAAGGGAGSTECSPGDLPTEDGCVPAGVPPDRCGAGFEPDGRRACRAVLPDACPFGTMALPGESSCREVAPCGADRFGDAPRDPTTQFVDASYEGGSNDGSEAHPWSSIQAGVDAARSGAVVAVAAGDYPEVIEIVDKAVRLWGRCPSLVRIAPPVTDAIVAVVAAGADGTVVRGVHLDGSPGGAQGGLFVSGAEVTLERSWIDAMPYGVLSAMQYGAGSVHVRQTLIERTTDSGVLADGGDVDLEGVRIASGTGHAGAAAQARPSRRPKVVVAGSVFEGNVPASLLAIASDLEVSGSVVRGGPAIEGFAMVHTQPNAKQEGPTLVLRGSVVERGEELAVAVKGGAAVIEDTTLAAVGAGPSGDGYGVVLTDQDSHVPPSLELRRCAISDVVSHGALVLGGSALLEGVLVRDVAPATNGSFGRGIAASVGIASGASSTLQLVGVAVERATEAAIVVTGSTATIDLTRVDETRPSPAGRLGRALQVQAVGATPDAKADVRRSRFRASTDIGVAVVDGSLTLSDTAIEDVGVEPATGLEGDGVVAVTFDRRASVTLRGVSIEHTARAGLSVFGADALVADTTFECTAIPIDAESSSQAAQVADGGGNTCSCASQPSEDTECRAQSAGLSPPPPL